MVRLSRYNGPSHPQALVSTKRGIVAPLCRWSDYTEITLLSISTLTCNILSARQIFRLLVQCCHKPVAATITFFSINPVSPCDRYAEVA